MTKYELWKKTHTSPFHFSVTEAIWMQSVYEDIDSDGRKLFDSIAVQLSPASESCDPMIVYGRTAFGFDEQGEISENVHYHVIRDLAFPADSMDIGQSLLDHALKDFDSDSTVYAFFHYFGMSCCGRHGKLHESQSHIHDLLLKNGFVVEHENIYYSKVLTNPDDTGLIKLIWKEINTGSCREFAAVTDGQEVCWGQVHFLPQGDIAYLRWIYVGDQFQHRGIGTHVMKALFSDLYKMGIRRFDTDTARSNTAAQGYYEKCGFTNEGITRSYFTK